MVPLFIGGFVFPVLFFVVAFFAYTIFDDLKNQPNPETTSRFLGRETVTVADAEWKLYYLQTCESPAEIEFLEAMIEAYDLLSDKGVLKGGQISLRLQVEVKPFRTDFLANDWPVVEIDGATYHSSPEALAKDRVRDQFFFEQGYGVLRIPAKIVFTTPEKAVSNVRSAIAVGRPPAMAKAVPQARPNQNWSLGKTLSSIGNTISELNTYVSTAQELEKATSTAREAFNLESPLGDL
jgi:very-short-patch-repair endonuclease